MAVRLNSTLQEFVGSKQAQARLKVKPRTGGTGLRVGGTHDGEGTLRRSNTNIGASVSAVDLGIYVTGAGE